MPAPPERVRPRVLEIGSLGLPAGMSLMALELGSLPMLPEGPGPPTTQPEPLLLGEDEGSEVKRSGSHTAGWGQVSLLPGSTPESQGASLSSSSLWSTWGWDR